MKIIILALTFIVVATVWDAECQNIQESDGTSALTGSAKNKTGMARLETSDYSAVHDPTEKNKSENKSETDSKTAHSKNEEYDVDDLGKRQFNMNGISKIVKKTRNIVKKNFMVNPVTTFANTAMKGIAEKTTSTILENPITNAVQDIATSAIVDHPITNTVKGVAEKATFAIVDNPITNTVQNIAEKTTSAILDHPITNAVQDIAEKTTFAIVNNPITNAVQDIAEKTTFAIFNGPITSILNDVSEAFKSLIANNPLNAVVSLLGRTIIAPAVKRILKDVVPPVLEVLFTYLVKKGFIGHYTLYGVLFIGASIITGILVGLKMGLLLLIMSFVSSSITKRLLNWITEEKVVAWFVRAVDVYDKSVGIDRSFLAVLNFLPKLGKLALDGLKNLR